MAAIESSGRAIQAVTTPPLPSKEFPKLPAEFLQFFPPSVREVLMDWEKKVDQWRKTIPGG